MPRTELEKYEVMRGCTPPVRVWLMNSKLKAWIRASRTRQSAKMSRRVLNTNPSMPEGR